MKIKTQDLIGMELDWAVAKCEVGHIYTTSGDQLLVASRQRYSREWAQGGPIIDREKISTWLHENGQDFRAAPKEWMLADPESKEFIDMAESVTGPTPLIAAMRVFVTSRLGDEVDIPEELLK